MIKDSNVFSTLKKHADCKPNDTAVIFNEDSLTYKELYNMVCHLAMGIIKSNIKEGERIAVAMDNSLNMVVCIIAILSVRCVVLPIDTELPLNRIKIIIEDAKPQIAFCNNDKIKEKINSLGYLCVKIDAISKENVLADTLEKYLAEFKSDDSAFCMYTSGSTGKPKGVIISYRGIINHANSKIKLLELSDDSNISLSFNIGFVASIWQIVTPIYLGAKLTIYPRVLIKQPYTFFKKIQEDQLSFISITPSTLKSYLYYVQKKKKIPLLRLNRIVLTGEKILPSLVNTFYKEYQNIQLINAYGQTECSDDTFHYIIPQKTWSENIPIGKPIDNIFCYVLNESFQEATVDEMGELYIGGCGLVDGYLNEDTLSSERFVSIPGIDGTLYRTGDIVKRNELGEIVYVGRRDNQVKIRGYRIELEEIENYISTYPKINEVLVVSHEKEGNKTLECLYTSDYIIDKTKLIEFACSLMPQYMVPARFTQIFGFLYNSSGKIDRSINYSELIVAEEDKLQPYNTLRGRIYEIIIKYIGFDVLKMDVKIATCGIDSISFVQMVIELEDEFGFEFAADKMALSEFATIADIIKYVESEICKNN